MTTHYQFISRKGGVGCSTVAALAALGVCETRRTLIVDSSPNQDVDAVLGMQAVSSDEPLVVSSGLWFANAATLPGDWSDYDIVIEDVGTNPPSDGTDRLIMVVRNCYLSLRRSIGYSHPHLVVAVTEPLRALRLADIETTMGARTIELPFDPAISRSVDAGLLVARPGRSAAQLGRHMIEMVPA